MKIISTDSKTDNPTPFRIIVMGDSGVGKTTFAAQATNAIHFDFEHSTEELYRRKIKTNVVLMERFFTAQEATDLPKIIEPYDTVVIDTIGSAMDCLVEDKNIVFGKKYRDSYGDLTRAGWFEVKKIYKSVIKIILANQKNLILIAHTQNVQDGEDEPMYKVPMITTNISTWLCGMSHVVALMEAQKSKETGQIERYLRVVTGDGKHTMKDRTDVFSHAPLIKADFDSILSQYKGS